MPSHRDAAIQSAMPTVIAEHDAPLPPLADGARRLVLAGDGLYLQLASPHLRASRRIAAFTTPYGPCRESIMLANGLLPRHLIASIVSAARNSPSTEIAAGIEATETGYRLVRPRVLSAGSGHVRFEDFGDGLVLDAHSHGSGEAFFSAIDDASDRSRPGPYIAVVISRVDTEPTITARLCAAPYLLPLDAADLGGLFG